jgi:hypothetical protein
MNLERAVSLARHALHTKDPADIHVAADAMEELDDIRAAAIHNHIDCCERAIAILRHFVFCKYTVTYREKEAYLFFPSGHTTPENWPCLI